MPNSFQSTCFLSTIGIDALCATLASNLNKLDTSNLVEDDDDRGIAVVKSWLWGDEGLVQYATTTLTSPDSIPKWNNLLRRLHELQFHNNGERLHSVDTISNLTPACKLLFHKLLKAILLPNGTTNKSCVALQYVRLSRSIPPRLLPLAAVAASHSSSSSSLLCNISGRLAAFPCCCLPLPPTFPFSLTPHRPPFFPRGDIGAFHHHHPHRCSHLPTTHHPHPSSSSHPTTRQQKSRRFDRRDVSYLLLPLRLCKILLPPLDMTL